MLLCYIISYSYVCLYKIHIADSIRVCVCVGMLICRLYISEHSVRMNTIYSSTTICSLSLWKTGYDLDLPQGISFSIKTY